MLSDAGIRHTKIIPCILTSKPGGFAILHLLHAGIVKVLKGCVEVVSVRRWLLNLLLLREQFGPRLYAETHRSSRFLCLLKHRLGLVDVVVVRLSVERLMIEALSA